MLEVLRSAVIPAPAGRVWALVRDFNAMPQWNATIRSSTIENGPADRIGCRRVLTFDDGGIWTHELTGLSDPEMTLSYAIVGIPVVTKLPMRSYRATIRLEPIVDGDQCFIAWRAWIDTDDAETVSQRANTVFQAGFDGLKRCFAS
jgi:hypothetical protein